MAAPQTPNDRAHIIAVFCDFENLAIGVRDAKYAQFDMTKVLERLLLKGSIVVKKAYCDWDRYKSFKAAIHEASFELIEIPHVRQSGKNSADIRMVVDALDLCYTNAHVDAFAIISGDSDFSPLVSKLRENGKRVVGVGVKNSTSDLFISNCDEFIYYDDLVRVVPPKARPRVAGAATSGAPKSAPAAATGGTARSPDPAKALEVVVATVRALTEERGADEVIWASMVKQAIKRGHPGFNERAYGFSAFTDLLREGKKRGVLRIKEDANNNWSVQLPE